MLTNRSCDYRIITLREQCILKVRNSMFAGLVKRGLIGTEARLKGCFVCPHTVGDVITRVYFI